MRPRADRCERERRAGTQRGDPRGRDLDVVPSNSATGRGDNEVVRSYAFVFISTTEYANSRVVVDLEDCRATMVAVPDWAAAERVAKELVDSGVQLVEFCGRCRLLRPAQVAANFETAKAP